MIIGYTQGTFDMFHIGHLNLIQNAKDLCDYLIVGVNSDELIKEYKNKAPIIPLYERLSIITALRYVDSAVSVNTLDKTISQRKYGYQKIFIGDDWKGNERWKLTEKELKLLGASVIYLPYTENTSSTLLREKLRDY